MLRMALCAFALAMALGCAGSSGGAGGAGAAGGSSSSGDDATEGGTRRAAEGAACDFGGAAERTCQRGLQCCYGPPDDPGEFGRCMEECPEY